MRNDEFQKMKFYDLKSLRNDSSLGTLVVRLSYCRLLAVKNSGIDYFFSKRLQVMGARKDVQCGLSNTNIRDAAPKGHV